MFLSGLRLSHIWLFFSLYMNNMGLDTFSDLLRCVQLFAAPQKKIAPLLFPSSILVHLPTWTHLLVSNLCVFSYCSWGSPDKKTHWSGFIPFSSGQRFIQEFSSMICSLEWPCTAGLIASLGYTSPFTTAGCDPWRGVLRTLIFLTPSWNIMQCFV